jgi:hypothetical protein
VSHDTFEAAKANALALANLEQRPYAVTVGYDDFDHLCWSTVPADELGESEEPEFMAQPE